MTPARPRRTAALVLAVAVALLLAVAAWRALGREDGSRGVERDGEQLETESRAEARLAPGEAESAGPATDVVEVEGARTAVEAAPRPSLVVRLVDEHTGESLPSFRLGLRPLREREAPVEWHETDSDGRFHSETAFGGADLKVELVDVDGSPWYGATTFAVLRFDADAGAYPAELAIESGPTYRLVVDPPADPLEATLTEWKPDPTRHVNYTPVRDGEPTWVRFRDRWDELEGSAWLEVRVAGGHLRGRARVGQLAGIAPEPVRITLLPTASVAGRLALPGGGPPSDGAMLHLVRRGERRTWGDVHGDRELWRLRGYADDGDGRFQFEHLEPGAYDLLVAEYGIAGGPFELDLPPGPTDLGELPVRERPVAGPVRGRLVSTSGLYEGPCHVGLWPVGRAVEVLLDESIDWEAGPDGRLFAPFEFEDVPAGEYLVYVDCHDPSDWGGALPVVTPPVEDLEIVLPHDPLTIVFRARADESGELLPEFEVEWRVRGERGWDPVVEDVASAQAAERLEWMVFAPGRVPRRGGAEVLDDGVFEGGMLVRRADVRLRAGWGDWALVLNDQTDEPLAGAELVLDGVSAGRTGADGRVWVETESPPRRVEVRLSGWEGIGGSITDWTSGEMDPDLAEDGGSRLQLRLRRLP